MNTYPFFKKILLSVIILSVILITPYIFSFLFSSSENENRSSDTTVSVPEFVTVHRTLTDKDEKIPFEEYVKGVVAGEMPYTFPMEALKAQAVAARTYAMSRLDNLCDTTHCQVYRSPEELEDLKGKEWMKKGYSRISKAVDDTKGELIYYDNKVISHALFHSSSGGRTENSEDVFVSAVPYLVSVESPYEDMATHKNEKATFTYGKIRKLVETSYPKVNTGRLSSGDIEILKRNEGGSVASVRVGDAVLSGPELRMALGLYSARFKVLQGEKKATFITSGSGHGVGMSQYGAYGMAEKGYDYREILTHYYHGTEVK